MSDRLLAGRRIAQADAERRSQFFQFQRLKAELKLIDRSEAAKLLGVTVRTLRRWNVENQGPPMVVFRRKRFYSLPDVLAHVEAKQKRRARRSTRTPSGHEIEGVDPTRVTSTAP